MVETQLKILKIERTEENADMAELIKRLHASELENRKLKAENDRLKVRIFDLTEGLQK